LSPNDLASLRIGQLHAHAHAISDLADGAGHSIADLEFACRRIGAETGFAENVGRVPGYHEQLVKSRETGRDVFGQSVCYPAIGRLGALILERKNDDRKVAKALVRNKEVFAPAAGRGNRGIAPNLEDLDRLPMIFQPLQSKVAETARQPVSDLLIY